jgi:glycosyltransferase involved in cell wall biosynthesis
MPFTGSVNYGYTFFENSLPSDAKKNAARFDLVFAGSTWCRDRLQEKGITWSDVLIQGIDPRLFYPVNPDETDTTDYFTIYSGGKLELRKSQDIVIRAVKVMQDRHKDILFVNCWHNSWNFSMNTMIHSPLIKFNEQVKCSPEIIQKILAENGIDLERTITLPRIPQDQFKKIYDKTDVGLFPNRCEGGTNLVMMEYMACGKPVVASYNSGHKDVLSGDNSILIKRMKPLELKSPSGDVTALWEEPDLDETIDALEFCYNNHDRIKGLGRKAGEDMKSFTWEYSARDLIEKIDRFKNNIKQ